MNRDRFFPLGVVILAVSWSGVNASPEESLVYDASTGNYVLTYDCAEDGGMVTTTIEPANKIAPAVTSGVEAVSGGVAYSYTISLGAASRQPLRMFALDPIQPVWDIVEPPTAAMLKGATVEEIRQYQEASAASAPSGWKAFHFTNDDGTSRVGWSRRGPLASTFVAGSRQEGFRFSSRHLPGIFAARLDGKNRIWSFPCESPDTERSVAGTALNVLRRNNHVPRFVAAPLIKVSDPFDGLGVLRSVHAHLAQLDQWQLLDASLSSELEAYLAEAIAKLERKDATGALVPLGRVRAAIRVRYAGLDLASATHATPPSPIPLNPVDEIRKLVTDYDRILAARVIDFDVGYVVSLLTPATTVTPASDATFDCAQPSSDTTCAPASDADGTFKVRWGAPSCPPSGTPVLTSCEMKGVLGYRLETANNAVFLDATTIYTGQALEFQVHGLPPGAHYFRVTAGYRYCHKGTGFGYSGSYCDEEDHWRTGSSTYTKGANKTTVEAR